jgi:hypothetical protein
MRQRGHAAADQVPVCWSLDLNWTALCISIHIQLTIGIINTYRPKILFAMGFPESDNCVFRGVSVWRTSKRWGRNEVEILEQAVQDGKEYCLWLVVSFPSETRGGVTWAVCWWSWLWCRSSLLGVLDWYHARSLQIQLVCFYILSCTVTLFS